MKTLWLPLVVFFAAACGHEEDNRPLTAEYIVATVLAPTCGRAGCHSEATKWEGYAFDSLPNAREALRNLVRAGDPDSSPLYRQITGDDPEMPPEGPLPEADIALIRNWILAGAEGIER